MNSDEDLFLEWLSYHLEGTSSPEYMVEDLQAAFFEGLSEGWHQATEYYRNGGTFR